jgi:hypothetical protein
VPTEFEALTQLAEGLIRQLLRLPLAVVPLDDLRIPSQLNEKPPRGYGTALGRPNEKEEAQIIQVSSGGLSLLLTRVRREVHNGSGLLGELSLPHLRGRGA